MEFGQVKYTPEQVEQAALIATKCLIIINGARIESGTALLAACMITATGITAAAVETTDTDDIEKWFASVLHTKVTQLKSFKTELRNAINPDAD